MLQSGFAKGTILKKINVSFIVHFCLGKYSFSLDTFYYTLRILKKINVPFVANFYISKYGFSLDTFCNTL